MRVLQKTGRVQIFRSDNLGDAVLFSGALRHMRQLFAGAEIVLATKRSVANYFDLCPYIDKIILWEDVVNDLLRRPNLNWIPSVPGKWRIETLLRIVKGRILRYRYLSDIAISPVRSPSGGRYGIHEIMRRVPARRKIGIKGDLCNQSPECDERADSIYTDRLFLSSARFQDHEMEVTKDFLSFIGVHVDLGEIWPEHWTDVSDKDWAARAIHRKRETTLVAICPGVTSLQGKIFTSVKMRDVFIQLKEHQFQVFLFGNKAEKKTCQDMTLALTGLNNILGVTDFSGKTSIRQLVEGLKACDIVLSQETGALHIAVSLHKPTVGILGGGHYGRFYPWGDQAINRVADNLMDCYWCNWKCKYDTIRCITEISPERIASELRNLIIKLPHRISPNRNHVLPQD